MGVVASLDTAPETLRERVDRVVLEAHSPLSGAASCAEILGSSTTPGLLEFVYTRKSCPHRDDLREYAHTMGYFYSSPGHYHRLAEPRFWFQSPSQITMTGFCYREAPRDMSQLEMEAAIDMVLWRMDDSDDSDDSNDSYDSDGSDGRQRCNSAPT